MTITRQPSSPSEDFCSRPGSSAFTRDAIVEALNNLGMSPQATLLASRYLGLDKPVPHARIEQAISDAIKKFAMPAALINPPRPQSRLMAPARPHNILQLMRDAEKKFAVPSRLYHRTLDEKYAP